jgi:hypothetical protein
MNIRNLSATGTAGSILDVRLSDVRLLHKWEFLNPSGSIARYSTIF